MLFLSALCQKRISFIKTKENQKAFQLWFSPEKYLLLKSFIIYHYHFESQSIWITLCCGYIRNNEYTAE